MEKFVPYEKLSKKKQREIDTKSRRSWGAVNPAGRKSENKKIYNRKRANRRDDYLSVGSFFVIA